MPTKAKKSEEGSIFTLYAHDNGSNMCSSADVVHLETGVPVCPACGYRTDFEYTTPGFKLGRRGRTMDLSYTYDGAAIASHKFRELCDREGYSGLRFRPIGTGGEFFHMLVNGVLRVDAIRSGVRFEKKCDACGNFQSVVGPSSYLLEELIPTDGIYRSDLLYASGNAKHPVLFVNAATRDVLRREKMRGLLFESAFLRNEPNPKKRA